MKRPKNKKEGSKTGKPGGFMHRETYFLAKEWLLKIYRQPARLMRNRRFKSE